MRTETNGKVRRIASAFLVLALCGCTSLQTKKSYDSQLPANIQRTKEAWDALRQAQARPDFVITDTTPIISTKSVPLSRDAALPAHINQVVFKFPGRQNLLTIAERISREVGIPVILTPDALRPASAFTPGGGTGGTSASPGPLVTGQRGGADATAVFSGESDLASLNVSAGDYQQTFELNYAGPLAGLLDKLAAMASLNWKYEDQRIIFYRVQTRSFVIKSMPGTFKLTSTLNGDSGGGASGSGSGSSSGGGGGIGGEISNETNLWTGLEANIKAMLSTSGKMNLDKNAGILVVTDGTEALSIIERYVEQMNQLMMRQIALEVEVITVDLNEANAAGIDWSIVNGALGGNISFSTPPSPPTSAQGGSPFTIEFNSATGNRSAMLRALQTFGQVSSAYSGVVVTANRTPAPISVSNTQAYVRQTTPGVVAGGGASGVVAASSGLTPGQVQTGTNILLMPLILESNQVMLECTIRISTLKELTRFDSGLGLSQQSVQLPNVDSFTMVQRMAIPSGKTMVVMGFDQARTASSTTGPFGQLVTGKTGSGNKQSIVVMITPRLADI